jgi:hypothetical protein
MALSGTSALALVGMLLGPPPPVQEEPGWTEDGAFATSSVPEDLNADGTVNAADLATFTADWKAARAGGA